MLHVDDFNLRSIGSRWRQVNFGRNYSGLVLPLTHKYKKFEIKRLLFRSVSADFKSVNLKLERGIQKLFDSERLNIYKFWIAISVIKTVYTFRDASCTKIHKTTLNYIKPYLTSSNYTKLQQTTLNNT